ncbi:hypothetical protein L6261_01165 [Candidatus Parcubacteria bacterium]|nr:hypothetical protein [Candidatus Parcubacteria bacterium]
MKKIIAVLFAIAIGSTSVQASEQQIVPQTDYSKRQVAQLSYFQDPRTGVCFALYQSFYHVKRMGISEVPCDKIPASLMNKEAER